MVSWQATCEGKSGMKDWSVFPLIGKVIFAGYVFLPGH